MQATNKQRQNVSDVLLGNLEQIIKSTTATSFYTFLEKIILHSNY